MPFGFGAMGVAFGRLGRGGGGSAKNRIFGVNISGPEFSPWNGQTFPTAADFGYLAGKGVTFARLPIAWESIQPTLSAALDPTYLASLNTALARAAAVGIKCIVDVHNYGCYAAQAQWTTTVPYAGNSGTFPATGVSILGNGLTSAQFNDLWTRLATALKGNAGLLGYGLMNEPQSSIVGPQLALSANNFGLTQGFVGSNWFLLNSATITQLAPGTNPVAGFSPAWQLGQGNTFGAVEQQLTLANVQYTFSLYVKVASGTQPFLLALGSNDGGHTATTSWQRFSFTNTPAAGAQNIGIVCNGANAPVQIANAQLELGAAATTWNPNRYFPFAQAAISAIRAVDATAPIYVCGQNFAATSTWLQYNYDNMGLTGGSLVHEAHSYPDGPQGIGDGGVFAGTFTSYSIDTQTAVNTNAAWLTWLSTYGLAGFLGEFAIPNSVADNNSQWFAVMTNALLALQSQRVPATQWFYGSNGLQPANILNIATAPNDPRLLQMLAIR